MTPRLNFLPTYKHQGSSDEMLQDVLPSLKILSRQIVPKLKAPSKKLSDSIQHRYCMDTIFPETAFCCIYRGLVYGSRFSPNCLLFLS